MRTHLIGLTLPLGLYVACAEPSLEVGPDAASTDVPRLDSGPVRLPDAGEADLGGSTACPELRNPQGVLGQADIRCESGRCEIPGGMYAGTISLTSDYEYVLPWRVDIGAGTPDCAGRLEVEAGTRLIMARDGYLVVQPYSRIYAEGSATEPIVFTSERSFWHWTGLFIMGRAPANCQGLSGFGEWTCTSYSAGGYGSDDPNDSSGALRYVRIERGGRPLNIGGHAALNLEGVGAGTLVEHVHIYDSMDDGIGIRGGTVELRNVVVSGAADDALDWELGWQGKLQFGLFVQGPTDGDNGIEADNNGSTPEAEPRSKPTLSHLTVVGSPSSTNSDFGLQLRAGTGGQIWSSVVVGFEQAGLDVDDSETFAHLEAQPGNVIVAHSVLCNARNLEEEPGEPLSLEELFLRGERFGWVSNEARDFVSGCNLGFTDRLFDEAAPDFVPEAASPLAAGGAVPNDAFFEEATYRGAVAPGTAEPWWGWTRFD